MKAQDQQFQEFTAQKVTPTTLGWIITVDPGWSVAVTRRPGGPEPHVGSLVRFYGLGLGFRVRGVDIDGQELYYRTPAQEDQRAREAIETYNHESR